MKLFKKNELLIFEYVTVIGLIFIAIFMCMNTYEINKLKEDNEELEYRIKLIETKNALYEPEDVNKDGEVDISDIALVRSRILKGE